VLDLRGHGRSLRVDLSMTTMEDYLADLESVTGQIERARGTHPVVGGWSMGGLIAQMYAVRHPNTPALLLLSPSAPVEVVGKASIEAIRSIAEGIFGPEQLGLSTSDFKAARGFLGDLTDDEVREVMANSAGAVESGMARRQRRRGISVPASEVLCPSLVLYGGEDVQVPPEQNLRLASSFGGDSIGVPGAGHWGIVCSDRFVAEAAPQVDDWLRRVLD
jgi:pimeloyl-ACP methyl ester carboxylesterase